MLDTQVPAVILRLDPHPFHHGTLGAVRSLGRARVQVHVLAESAGGPVPRSRFLYGLHRPPPPHAPLGDVAAALGRVAARIGRPAVLVPMDDAGAIAVDRLRPSLTRSFLLPEQPPGLPERVADKAALAELCGELGVPHPRTVLPGSGAEAATEARLLGFPVVAKWSRPWLMPPGRGLRSTILLGTQAQARELYQRADEAGSTLLLQRFLPPGPGRDRFFHGYADHTGVLRGGGSGVKLRSWPPRAGLTAVGRWLPEPAVEAAAARLVTALGYRGILDLDFRLDAATGTYCLLDFNPRPGAQFRLFADRSGLDVLRAQHLDLTGRPCPEPEPRPGRTFVVESYAPFAALRPSADPGPGGREMAWFSTDDLLPSLAMAPLWCRHVATRLRERLLTKIGRPARSPADGVRPPARRRSGVPVPAAVAPLPRPAAPLPHSGESRTSGGTPRLNDKKASSC